MLAHWMDSEPWLIWLITSTKEFTFTPTLVCLFVCLSVSRITQKLVGGFLRNLAWNLELGKRNNQFDFVIDPDHIPDPGSSFLFPTIVLKNIVKYKECDFRLFITVWQTAVCPTCKKTSQSHPTSLSGHHQSTSYSSCTDWLDRCWCITCGNIQLTKPLFLH